MTLPQIIARLEADRQQIDLTLVLLRSYVTRRRAPKAKARRRRLHWTQRPENKAKLRQVVARMKRGKQAKASA